MSTTSQSPSPRPALKLQALIWMCPKIGVPQNGWFIMENPYENGWFGGFPPILVQHPYIRNAKSTNHIFLCLPGIPMFFGSVQLRSKCCHQCLGTHNVQCLDVLCSTKRRDALMIPRSSIERLSRNWCLNMVNAWTCSVVMMGWW